MLGYLITGVATFAVGTLFGSTVVSSVKTEFEKVSADLKVYFDKALADVKAKI